MPLQLRIYTLKSASLAKSYVPYWQRHSNSLLANHNVKTLGVYTSHTSPDKLISIVQYPEGGDPDATMKEYTTSEQFKKDLEGFPIENFKGVQTEVLEKVEYEDEV